MRFIWLSASWCEWHACTDAKDFDTEFIHVDEILDGISTSDIYMAIWIWTRGFSYMECHLIFPFFLNIKKNYEAFF